MEGIRTGVAGRALTEPERASGRAVLLHTLGIDHDGGVSELGCDAIQAIARMHDAQQRSFMRP